MIMMEDDENKSEMIMRRGRERKRENSFMRKDSENSKGILVVG